MSDRARADMRILPEPGRAERRVLRAGPRAASCGCSAAPTCGTWRHPPRHRCAACGSLATHVGARTGRGRIFSWTITHQALDPAFEVPYAVVVVELEEGPRPGRQPPRPGAVATSRSTSPVVAVLEPVSDTVALVHFRPAADVSP